MLSVKLATVTSCRNQTDLNKKTAGEDFVTESWIYVIYVDLYPEGPCGSHGPMGPGFGRAAKDGGDRPKSSELPG